MSKPAVMLFPMKVNRRPLLGLPFDGRSMRTPITPWDRSSTMSSSSGTLMTDGA